MIRVRADLLAEARRADRSLADLLSIGDVVRVTATTANRRAGDPAAVQDEVVLTQPATLTVSSPPSPAADATTTAPAVRQKGKLNVLTYRGGRVDSTAECVPCAYDYMARRRRIDIRVWQLSAIGYVRRISRHSIRHVNLTVGYVYGCFHAPSTSLWPSIGCLRSSRVLALVTYSFPHGVRKNELKF